MKKHLIKFILVITLATGFGLPGKSTELPAGIVDFVKNKYPEAGIRFDGMVELPDETKYLPVLPLVRINEQKAVNVVFTIPEDTDFANKPDLILFSNNFALLKIIEKENEPPTVINNKKIPLKVKLGLLPQDMVVPKGLELPPELKVILGDLKIPLKKRLDKEGEVSFYGKTELNEIKEGKIVGKTTEHLTKIPELSFLKGQKIYTSCYKTNKLKVIDTHTGRVFKEIQLPSMVLDMAITNDKRYILLSGAAVGEIFVIDALNNEFVKAVPVGKYPTKIIISDKSNTAYVANFLSSTISEIELTNMQVKKQFNVNGYPDCIKVSEISDFLFYNDASTGQVYQLNLKNGFSRELFEVKNISKLDKSGRYIFALSRTSNTLTVYDLKKSEVIATTKTGKKPLDMKIANYTGKIIVVCAESDELNIIDMEKFDVVNNIPLKSNGFPGNIWLDKDSGKALISNYDSYEIIIYNVNTEKIYGNIPVNMNVSSIVTSDK